MRTRLFGTMALAAFLTLGVSAQAQTATGARRGPGSADALREKRGELRDRLKDLTPEQRKAAMDRAKNRAEDRKENRGDRGASEEMKAWVAAFRAENKSVHDAVKAGTIDRQTAASQLKAWREAHPRPRPASRSE